MKMIVAIDVRQLNPDSPMSVEGLALMVERVIADQCVSPDWEISVEKIGFLPISVDDAEIIGFEVGRRRF